MADKRRLQVITADHNMSLHFSNMSYLLAQFFVVLLVLFSCILEFRALGDKIEKKIYKTIQHVSPCVTLLNATHQIGCTSKRKGNVGVLHYIESDEDFKWLLNDGEHAPYIALFEADYFTDDRFKKLVDADKVSGALVYGFPSKGFSPEYSCPNNNFGLYKDDEKFSCSTDDDKSVVWNKIGSEMSYRNYDVPVFALTSKVEYNALVNCYKKHNKVGNETKQDYPLCGVELQSFMFAAKDTPTCMRKNNAASFASEMFCDPLGDHNVWGTLFPMFGNLKKDDVILATAQLDSTSFFHDIAPGADNDATGVIALLAAAEALGRLKHEGKLTKPDLKKNEKHIMFSYFQGEVWDYIGSSRMVYDMMNGDFPCADNESGCKLSKVNVTNIAYFLELNQVGLQDEGALWAHSDPLSKGPKVAKMFQVLRGFGAKVKLSIKNASNKTDQPLPPASFQQFLKKQRIPGLVLTDHKTSYTNKFYNSRFDNALSLNKTSVVNHLTLLATTVAKTLYGLAYSDTKENITARSDVVGDLFECFLKRANCLLFQNVTTTKNAKILSSLSHPLNRYVGPFDKHNVPHQAITEMTKRVLAYYTGDRHNKSNYGSCADDKGNYGLFVMEQGRTCVNSTVYVSPALSPAFLNHDYSSTEYSTWTESRWGSDVSVRMFLIADPSDEVVTLVVGIILTLISLVITTFMYKKADQLFTPDNSMLVINEVQ